MTDWTPLTRELACWRAEGLTLPLWWRDDDAVSPTPQLERLASLSDRLGIPVHLAVIPAGAEPALAVFARARPNLIPLVHGQAHRSHAPEGEKKAEFGAHRPAGEALADVAHGLETLRGLFGADLRPVFVPPRNRIAPDIAAGLPALGFRILSTAAPRRAAEAAPGLAQVNTHLDPIDWHGTRGLVDPQGLVAQAAGLLADRRAGRADACEPFGLLTHHLVHDEDVWAFAGELLARLRDGPVSLWTAPKDQGTER